MVAPLIESVPPVLYGGTERVVSALTEELVQRGHEVVLFASGDSRTGGELVACCRQSLRLNGYDFLPNGAELCELANVYDRAAEFDIIHNHLDWLAFPFTHLVKTPTISTAHGRLDLPQIMSTFNLFPDQPLVSISDSQRRPLPLANWQATVYNGIATEHFHFHPNPGNYLVFIGRISPEKRLDRAIRLAEEVDMKLVIAAKVDPADRDYYEAEIAPLLRESRYAEFIGEVNEQEKDELLGHAFACLFPIDWPEPFGLTMVESMATGTPVIAWRGGSVDEVIVPGFTGFVCESLAEMATAVRLVPRIDRLNCRVRVLNHFSAEAMADGYEEVYAELISAQIPPGSLDRHRR